MSNKLEQEVKFCIKDLKALEKRLITLGTALKQPRTHEINLRFDTPDRRLTASFQVLRLRHDQRSLLTYKSARDAKSDVSASEELEVEVSDLKTAQAILEALGYEVIVKYEKFRTVYTLGEAEISLDEMPFGCFCEIEGVNSESIRRCAEALGLDWEKRSKLSYLALFSIAKEKLHLDIPHLTFDAFRAISVLPSDLGLMYADKAGG